MSSASVDETLAAEQQEDENEPVTGADRAAAAKLTLWYFVTATAILAVSGILGMILRNSQADLGRIGDNAWYAVMTAHGLGAFVGWGAFAVMGFSFWVLAQLGFPLRKWGLRAAWTGYWSMVVGVAIIVVSTLILNFAGSWVFLYPLPFEAAGKWSGATAGLFSAGALMAGVSIITWCISILHTIIGPALHAVSTTVRNRIGLALGMGYLWPRRFATNPRKVPYPIIPLAVISIDMIIATTPLAVLLVFFIVKAGVPGLGIDTLGAKNILWFFGHPVVYLLLFPAAAIYYHLIPKFAGRKLVAGNIIAVAWAIAVIANVVVWAHHVYLDYPQNSVQGALNTAMQPTTFALTIPSALSLYSLGFTIFRSNFKWNAASTALVLGLFGWLTAGLSGVINATIVFDAAVHNSLWIVGHFHHMALLNIGFLIFGASYHYLPQITGKRLWSESMAKTHIWITFVAATGFFVIWLVEGLYGAPRRFAVLPERYDAFEVVSIPFLLILVAAQFLYFVNIAQTMRGAAGTLDEPAPERRKRRPLRLDVASTEAALVVTVLALMVASGVGGWLIGRGQSDGPPAEVVSPAEPAAPGEPVAPSGDGAALFDSGGCATCHTFSIVGATGEVGPSLDDTTLDARAIEDIVANGVGAMPGFSSQLTAEEINELAGFIASGGG